MGKATSSFQLPCPEPSLPGRLRPALGLQTQREGSERGFSGKDGPLTATHGSTKEK